MKLRKGRKWKEIKERNIFAFTKEYKIVLIKLKKNFLFKNNFFI